MVNTHPRQAAQQLRNIFGFHLGVLSSHHLTINFTIVGRRSARRGARARGALFALDSRIHGEKVKRERAEIGSARSRKNVEPLGSMAMGGTVFDEEGESEERCSE